MGLLNLCNVTVDGLPKQALGGRASSVISTPKPKKLEVHRLDTCRDVISDAHWNMVRSEKEAQGYDKKAYEHACQILVSKEVRARQHMPQV